MMVEGLGIFFSTPPPNPKPRSKIKILKGLIGFGELIYMEVWFSPARSSQMR